MISTTMQGLGNSDNKSCLLITGKHRIDFYPVLFYQILYYLQADTACRYYALIMQHYKKTETEQPLHQLKIRTNNPDILL